MNTIRRYCRRARPAFVENEKKQGHKVIMIGDGINDSPALSAASAGIAISDGAEIAREIADITISANDLREIVILKRLSNLLMARIHKNYRKIVGINTMLIILVCRDDSASNICPFA